MAADDEEDGKSDKKDDDSLKNKNGEPISAMQQEFENKIKQDHLSYEERVSIVLSGWERLAGSAHKGQFQFASSLYKWTLQLVLQGEWPKLEMIVKTRLRATLQRCTYDSNLNFMSRTLLPLVNDPWGHSTLKEIFAGSTVPDSEIDQYIFEESWQVVRCRVDTLVASRCEELALSLIKACMSCIKGKSDIAELLLNAQEDHNHFVDLYFVLLYKCQKKLFREEVRQMDIMEGVDHVRRLLAQKSKEKVWKHRLKIAELEIQIFLTSIIVKPYDDTFKSVLAQWCEVMTEVENENDVLLQMVRKYIQLSESSKHVYVMGSILYEKFGETHADLVTELLIRALTLDMNSLEVVKLAANEQKNEEQTRLEQQMANGFVDLSIVFRNHSCVARECVLTAFSLHPTALLFDKIKEFISCNNQAKDSVLLTVKSEVLDCPEEGTVSSIKAEIPPTTETNMGENTSSDSVEKDIKSNLSESTEERSQIKRLDTIEPVVSDSPSVLNTSQHIGENKDSGSLKSSVCINNPSVKEICSNIPVDNSIIKNEDSMDEFLAGTEGLIQQLNVKKEESVEKNNSGNTVVNFDVLSDPQAVLNSERLGIAKELCDDLAVVLSSPRWQVLSWMLGKSKLLSVCEKYLRNSEGAKNLTKELKFLNLDYSQFQHIPSAEIDEFYGIEKGYEHYMDDYSNDEKDFSPNSYSYTSSSDGETRSKDSRGNKGKRLQPSWKSITSSDSDSGRPKSRLRTTTSISESDDSNSVSCEFEGKRITAVSCNDRRKRLKVDISTGKVRPLKQMHSNSHSHKYNSHSTNDGSAAKSNIRLVNFDYKKPKSNAGGTKIKTESASNRPPAKPASSPNVMNSNWKYAGYIIGRPPNEVKPNTPAVSIKKSAVDSSINRDISNKIDSGLIKKQTATSAFEQSFAKFLMQKKLAPQNSKITDLLYPKKLKSLDYSLESLKKQGTSVMYKRDMTNTLVNAQKSVLNQIMSPENSKNVIIGRSSDNQLPVRAIAMPVSHNPPNLAPDKSNPPGLNRVLPKGTTVVRRPKSDSGAGTSGLNNGGTTVVITRAPRASEPRPAVSITPSSNFIGTTSSSFFVGTDSSRVVVSPVSTIAAASNSAGSAASLLPSDNASMSPLTSATVLPNVSLTQNLRLNTVINSPAEIQGGLINVNSNQNVSVRSLGNTSISTNTVVTLAGEGRAPSMLESLLRDTSTPSPLTPNSVLSVNQASTATTASFPDPIVASSLSTIGNIDTLRSSSSSVNTIHSNAISNSSINNEIVKTNETVPGVNADISTNVNLANLPVINNPVSSNVFSPNIPASVISSGIVSQVTSTVPSSNTPISGNMHQLLLPAQFIQVQGTSGLGIVHSGSLDLRLPPGTRVIKSSSGNLRPSAPVVFTQAAPRPLNVLHNVKLVQNRQVVRTVVVPHSMALQGLSNQTPTQLIAINQNPGSSNVNVEGQTGTKFVASHLKQILGQNVVPGGLVIRAIRPGSNDSSEDQSSKPLTNSIVQHISELPQQSPNKDKTDDKPAMLLSSSHEESFPSNRQQYIKAIQLAANGTQNVGTQTQTTAVKPASGQIVNQVVMNHLHGVEARTPTTVSVSVSPNRTTAVPSSSGLSHLALASSNAVSSETLEQLREFESVFEKVSNKSVKDSDSMTANPTTYPSSSVSSEESMIAAQLLSMANETPAVTSSSSYVYTIPASTDNMTFSLTVSPSSTLNTNTVASARIGEGTYITIPNSAPGGTLILVNPTSVSNQVALNSPVQNVHPPPVASPALSTTSSHSSVPSSPSSSSSKSKNKSSSKPNPTTPSSTPVTPTKPKSPPPPKIPPKPAVTKPQVEESDETKARIQAILDQYKQDLANTPQPQPAPRNRKNCPPPKNEGKSSSKKKSHSSKKPDGSSNSSPGDTSDSGHLPSTSPSPAPLAGTPDDSDGSLTGVSGSNQFQSEDEKVKTEEGASPQIVQGVVVSNVKMDSGALGSSLPQGRLMQLIRHGNKLTAITTRQPYQKAKAVVTAGGPPPNVTIQGRINMNDLVENHLASLLAGGSATINQSSALITKLIQAQQQQNAPVQQVLVQNSSGTGHQVLQQVSLQPILANAKSSGQIICVTGPNVINKNVNSAVKNAQSLPTIVRSLPITISSNSPSLMSSENASLGDDPPSADFAAGDESNSSEDSSEVGQTAAPLPPFFTLTKNFMVPSQTAGTSKLSTGTASVSVGSQTTNASTMVRSSVVKTLSISSQATTAKSPNLASAVMLTQSAPPSPLINAADSLLDMSPASGPSSMEGSPSLMAHRLPLVTSSELRTNSMDSVKSDPSVEEVHIPPSPATLTKQLQNAYMADAALSPNVSQQSHMLSSRSYSSPSTVQDLQLATESHCLSPSLAHTSHTYALAGQNSRVNNLSNGGNSRQNSSMDNNTITGLSSPSGDVYLDQSEVGLGLDNINLGESHSQSPSLSDLGVPAAPMLSWSPRSADSMMANSPSLNEALTGNMTLDIQNSEDSLCDSSTAFPGLFNVEGDGASISSNNSEDLLNANSSTASATMPVTSLSHSSSLTSHPSGNSFGKTFKTYGKRLPNHEQDHTISSTHSDSLSLSRELSAPVSINDSVDLFRLQDSSNSPASAFGDNSWKLTDSPVAKGPEDESSNGDKVKVENETSDLTLPKAESPFTDNDSNEISIRTLPQRASRKVQHNEKTTGKFASASKNMNQNGVEVSLDTEKKESEDLNEEPEKKVHITRSQAAANQINSSVKQKPLKMEVKTEVSPKNENESEKCSTAKEEKNSEEECSRVTRGAKRRNEIETPREEKCSKNTRSKINSTNSSLNQGNEETEKSFNSLLEESSVEPFLRSLRRRHPSGASDSSSSYSVDRVSTPGSQDSPLDCGVRRRKRRGSHDSSISSRDGSPLTIPHVVHGDGGTSASMQTRRSSSRDHSKKARCRCCVDTSGGLSSGSTQSRKSSGRVGRSTNSSTVSQ